MLQCNRCDRPKCDILDLIRAKKIKATRQQLGSSCKRFVPPVVKGEPLILQLLDKQPQTLHDLLSDHYLRLKELADPPYFKIVRQRRYR